MSESLLTPEPISSSDDESSYELIDNQITPHNGIEKSDNSDATETIVTDASIMAVAGPDLIVSGELGLQQLQPLPQAGELTDTTTTYTEQEAVETKETKLARMGFDDVHADDPVHEMIRALIDYIPKHEEEMLMRTMEQYQKEMKSREKKEKISNTESQKKDATIDRLRELYEVAALNQGNLELEKRELRDELQKKTSEINKLEKRHRKDVEKSKWTRYSFQLELWNKGNQLKNARFNNKLIPGIVAVYNLFFCFCIGYKTDVFCAASNAEFNTKLLSCSMFISNLVWVTVICGLWNLDNNRIYYPHSVTDSASQTSDAASNDSPTDSSSDGVNIATSH